MKRVRISVEWLFGLVEEQFRFLDFKKQHKIGLSECGKWYVIAALLANAKTCLDANQCAVYFDMHPPALENYFGV